MKNFLLIVFLSCLLFSCTKEEDLIVESEKFSLDQYPQKWQLVSMSGNIANTKPLIGTDMAWQEYYVLNADGTFKKHRDQNGTIMKASGTFTLKKFGSDDWNYLVLAYEAPNSIIGDCSSDPEEILAVLSSEELKNTWNICDGPGLLYKRVKYDVPTKVGN